MVEHEISWLAICGKTSSQLGIENAEKLSRGFHGFREVPEGLWKLPEVVRWSLGRAPPFSLQSHRRGH